MDGYQTTVIKCPVAEQQTHMVHTLLGFIVAAGVLYYVGGTASGLTGLFVMGVITLFAAISARSTEATQLSWGPRGILFRNGLFKQTIPYNEVAMIATKIQLSKKKKAAFLVVADATGKQRMKIDTSLFDESDVDCFVRCIQNNTRAALLLEPMIRLRSESQLRPFAANGPPLKLTEPKR